MVATCRIFCPCRLPAYISSCTRAESGFLPAGWWSSLVPTARSFHVCGEMLISLPRRYRSRRRRKVILLLQRDLERRKRAPDCFRQVGHAAIQAPARCHVPHHTVVVVGGLLPRPVESLSRVVLLVPQPGYMRDHGQ